MRNLKRALSLALASVMLLGMMVVGTSAATYPDVTSDHNVEAIEVLNAAGVMVGDDKGNFNPDQVVTRAEMAVVICRLLYGQDLSVASFADVATFSDVQPWAQGFVNLCASLGIVAGVGDGKFDPDATVTTAQAALMILRALEVEVEINENTDYKVAAMTAAEDADLFEGLDVLAANAGLTRNNVAQMALNAMKYNESETVYAVVNTETGKYHEMDELKDALMYAALLGDGWEVYETKDYSGSLIDEVFEIAVYDWADAYGRPATAYEHEDWNAVLTFADKTEYRYTINEATRLGDLIEDNKLEKKITDLGAHEADDILVAGSRVELFVNDDKVLTALVSYTYGMIEIEDVTEIEEDDSKYEEAFEDGAKFVIELENGDELFDINFPAFDVDTYVEGAKLVLTGAATAYDFENLDDEYDFVLADCAIAGEVEGKANTVTKDYIRIDGVKYIPSYTCAPIAKSAEGTFYLDPNGFVVGFAEAEEEAATIDDVIYTIATYTKTEKDEYGTETVTTYAQVMTLDGEIKNLVIAIDGEDDYGTTDNFVEGKLYTYDTYTAKKEVNGINYKGCSKLTAWDGNDDYYVGSIAKDTELETSDTKVTADIEDKNVVRLNNKTSYVMVDGKLADAETDVNVGGVNTTLAKDAIVIATKSGTNYIASIVILPGSEVDTAVDYDNVIYVDGETEDWEETEIDDTDYIKFAYYDENGKYVEDYENWIIMEANGDAMPDSGFYTYSIDEDGIYELEAVEVVKLTENYDDEAGVISGAFADYYEDEKLLTLDGQFMEDINTADAIVIDLADADIDNVKDIAEAAEDATVEMTIYVNDGAQIIVVTKVG